MTQAVTARRDGDTFQARLFWQKAARLLDPAGSIVKVGFEQGPKGFDDIWVEYDPARSPNDQMGRPLRKEHIQTKWHAAAGNYGFADLADPEFINANSVSLLQRARVARELHGQDRGVRFKLVTNWRIGQDDPLREIVGTRSNAIRVGRLFGTKTDASKVGLLRKTWREHLGIDEAELREFAPMLAFGAATDSLDELRDGLDVLFGFVGLRRVAANESAFPYDDLVFQWMGQERMEFDRTSFRAACAREQLLSAGSGVPSTFGVKSFEHPIDKLEDRCEAVLDLVPEFDDRYIRDDASWAGALYPEIGRFMRKAAGTGGRVRLALDTHVTLAFAAGSILNIASGRHVDIEQRTTSRRIWSPDDAEPAADWATLSLSTESMAATAGPDIAVAVGLTHGIGSQVRKFVETEVPSVGSLIVAVPSTGPGARSIMGGRHAFDLAGDLVAAIRAARETAPGGTVHLFMAVPNAFAFYLGQRKNALGRVSLYEYDFDGGRSGSYKHSLTLPLPAVAALAAGPTR